MTHDFSKAFASAGNRAVISEKEWSEGWFAIVGGINGIPTAQQFNTVSYLIESKVNEAYRVASQALTGLDSKVNITAGYGLMADEERGKLQGIYAGSTKTEGSATNGNIKINGVEKQVYRHPTGPGNEHIPTGGTAGQVLQKTADGYGWGAVTPTDVEKPIKNAPALTTIGDNDTVPFTDVADASNTKKITWLNLKAQLNVWASAIFAPKSHSHDDRYYGKSEMDSSLSGKLDTSGDGKSTTVTFTEATSRTVPASGESQATLWGKVRKLFTDLKAIAFSGSYTDLANVPGTFPPSGHTHGTGDINSGVFPVGRGGTGVASFPSGELLIGNGAGAVQTVSPATLSAKVGLAYGICNTAAATTAKTVSVASFLLTPSSFVSIKFAYGVPNNATLNINGTGAYPIRWMGNAIEEGGILAGDTCEFVYTGSSWNLLVIDRLASVGGVMSVSFAADSWATIQKMCSNGKYKKCYSIGDTKPMLLSTGETIIVRIEDFDHDDLDSGGKAPLSIAFVDGMNTTRQMNSSDTNSGGWNATAYKAWVNTLLSQLPADLQPLIKTVNKKSSAGSQSSSIVTTKDKLWPFSYTEVGFPHDASYSPGGEGTPYPLFTSDASRIKKVNGSAAYWWLRSPFLTYSTLFCIVSSGGTRSSSIASNSSGVVVGFCI